LWLDFRNWSSLLVEPHNISPTNGRINSTGWQKFTLAIDSDTSQGHLADHLGLHARWSWSSGYPWSRLGDLCTRFSRKAKTNESPSPQRKPVSGDGKSTHNRDCCGFPVLPVPQISDVHLSDCFFSPVRSEHADDEWCLSAPCYVMLCGRSPAWPLTPELAIVNPHPSHHFLHIPYMFQNQLIGLYFLVNKVLFQFLYIIGLSMIFPCLSIFEYLLLELNVYL